MVAFIDEFVGQYPVSKTLRFEARPVPETKKWLESDQCSVLFNDQKRNEYYGVLKELLDDYYRAYIEDALTSFTLDKALLENAYDLYCNRDTNAFSSCCEKLRKDLVKAFGNLKDYLLGSDQLKDLVKLKAKVDAPAGKGKKKIEVDSRLINWLNNNAKYSAEDREKYIKAIESFEGFVTYLTNYKQARENMFSSEDKSTAIAFRVIDQNMVTYFGNIRIYEKIKAKYPELYSALKGFEKFFSPTAYSEILSQSKIDEYNYQCIGRPIDDADFKGVNSLINEYRQKNGIKARELPVMSMLYKQILSDRDNSFMSEVINRNEEAIECAKNGYKVSYALFNELLQLYKKIFTEDNYGNIYVKTQPLTELSQALFGDWSILRNALDNGKYDKDIINLAELEKYFSEYCKVLDADDAAKIQDKFNLKDYFIQKNALDATLPDLDKITQYKPHLDAMLQAIRKYKLFSMYNGRKKMDVPENGIDFSNEFNAIYDKLSEFSILYDRIRNFATKKPYSDEKMKLSFNMPTMLAGWDYNNETANGCFLFIKDGKYFLGVADSKSKNIFDFKKNPHLLDKYSSKDIYYKVKYKQVSGSAKMLPKVVFAGSNEKIFGHLISKRILEIREKKLYTAAAGDRKAVAEWIDFMKSAIAIHPEWNEYFKFKFKNTAEYDNANKFYEDIDKQTYSLEKVEIPTEYIDEMVSQHKLYLFQLYTKDFSDKKKKKGTDNLHTMYWHGVFSDENLKAVTEGTQPIIKLNGEAEMFMRNPSIEFQVTHEHNKPIANKNPLNTKKESVFNYDLIKDKRYTERKFYFHCPITLNFRADKPIKYNEKINRFVENNPDVCIIGIDRGERHLLYYTVINQTGDILEQGSLNKISGSYTNDKGEKVNKETDYHDLLDRKEKGKHVAQQAWETIENIKELKAGYLSQVVYKLTQLMLQYNAVIVLENLNVGFKRGRTKVEKQVYQKFEKAMIDKLNYLVFKDRGYEMNGSYAKGLQLTDKFESFDKIGKQTGCIYYVIPSYTSHIDPKTGFVNLLNAKLRYENITKAQDTIRKFDSISYNAKADYFEFAFDYRSFGVDMARNEWVVCTCGDLRWEYSAKTRETKAYSVTDRLKELFKAHGIDYVGGENLVSHITEVADKHFLSTLLFYLRLVLKMRYTVSGTENENDFILSPVEYAPGKFFDSREATSTEPMNADANGAYHIALKGLMTIRGIEDGKLHNYGKGGENAAWFKFMQNQEYKNNG
ncbi:type V CRISPR-associated protein Cas12a/Cpf1 [Anaerovibrio sp. RM50]|uniref:type V CRISPR-associated protein Cas12a/Cpf1 n=1 Tax=Anaerovibrio sp. RM50 TaxID=1200557 RepID=UPI0004863A1A|nr:type V CRISPR-associated protein Cas12a/Cpf1 [Anaerovibrio sp. RM50]